jgi:hypothetical protein
VKFEVVPPIDDDCRRVAKYVEVLPAEMTVVEVVAAVDMLEVVLTVAIGFVKSMNQDPVAELVTVEICEKVVVAVVVKTLFVPIPAATETVV